MKQAAIFLAAAVSLAGAVTHADAAEGWSGFYAGLESGAAHNAADMAGSASIPPQGGLMVYAIGAEPEFAAGPGGAFDSSASAINGLGGAYAGYDFSVGNFVVGAIIDADIAAAGSLHFGDTAGLSVDWMATARVRAGWAASERLLVFASVGAAIAGVETTVTSFPGVQRDKSAATGYAAGLGAEYRFAKNWSLKGEFLHADFGTVRIDSSGTAFKLRTEAFKLGVAYRF